MAKRAAKAAAPEMEPIAQERKPKMPATEVWDEESSGGVLNLEEIDENAGQEPLPPGNYPFQVEEANYGPSQSSGKPMITLRLRINDSENPDYNNRVLFYHMVLEGFGIQRLKKSIIALAPDTDLANFKPSECADIFVGTRGTAKVTVRPYEGRRVNNVKDIMADGGGGFFG